MKIYGLLLTLSLGYLQELANAQSTISIGVRNGKAEEPFGISAIGAPFFTGEYQQVYAASAFPSMPVQITSIAFSEVNPGALTANYSLSVGLGVTKRTPANFLGALDTGFTTIFAGSLSPVFTAASGDFDFVINFTSPFYYDPARGNLFLDVNLLSASGDNVVFGLDEGGAEMGAVWINGGIRGGHPDYGLVTQFTVVPEPSTLRLCGAMALLGLSLFRRVRRHGTKPS